MVKNSLHQFKKPQAVFAGDHTKLSVVRKEALIKEIKKQFEVNKVFLNENLSLKFFADQLNTNTHYLSEVINKHFKIRFSTLVNRYRIQEAIRLLSHQEYQNITIEAISKQVGFHSKSAFNQSFKSIHHCTPKRFRRSLIP